MQDLTHLLNRIAFGPRPGQTERVQQMGVENYLEEQFRSERIDDSATERRISDLVSIPKPLDPPPQILANLQAQKLIRAVHSERQLQEVMTDFWFNHFNIFWRKNADRWLTTDYEMHAIRPHVLGKFHNLLMATAKSPAMLVYLDNHLSSSIRGINENYARELMELHTLGVNGGYTQKDVQEVARALTGWSIQAPKRGGDFMFRPRIHDEGEKVVLGHKIAAGGIHDGEMVIDILAKHPSTARFISTKLVRRFVADDPPESFVKHITDIYKTTGGDIGQMVHAIVRSNEFNSPQAVRAKTKSPFEYTVSAIRSLDGSTDGGRQLAQAIAHMGEPLYQCQPPTGYPDRGDYWLSTGAVLERLNFAVALTAGRIQGTSVNFDEPMQSVIKRIGSPEFQRK
jgi:uncharacterized protein (DUF1800 family)